MYACLAIDFSFSMAEVQNQ